MANDIATHAKYTREFYDSQSKGSGASAEVIVPFLLSMFPCKSVVDVGCGVGGWLKTFERCGVSDYMGLDGDYLTPELLQIPINKFRAVDLERLVDIGREFDLACSLEVAEHLSPECAPQFVAALVRAAPVVLFSAATPWQGGVNHVNLRWQDYWSDLFGNHGYTTIDCIRPFVYENPAVAWWYRQNTLVYCKPEHCPSGHLPVKGRYELNRIDPALMQYILDRPHHGRQALALMGECLLVLKNVILRMLRLGG